MSQKKSNNKQLSSGAVRKNNRDSPRIAAGVKPILRDLLKRLGQGWELISDAVSVTDPETNRLLYVNPAWRKLYGYTFKQALNKPVKMLNLRDFPIKVQQTILAQTRASSWSGRLLNKNSTGRVFPVDLRTSRLLDAEGEMIGLLGVATPVRQYNISGEIIQQLVERHQIVLTRELRSMLETALITTDGTAQVGSHGKTKKGDSGNGSGNSQLVSGIGRLSPRELEVFTLIGGGLGTREIAEKLGVSAYTIQTHRNHIKEKLNLPNAAAITYWAIQWAHGGS
jgi:PAS domain S-box-containing protein